MNRKHLHSACACYSTIGARSSVGLTQLAAERMEMSSFGNCTHAGRGQLQASAKAFSAFLQRHVTSRCGVRSFAYAVGSQAHRI